MYFLKKQQAGMNLAGNIHISITSNGQVETRENFGPEPVLLGCLFKVFLLYFFDSIFTLQSVKHFVKIIHRLRSHRFLQ